MINLDNIAERSHRATALMAGIRATMLAPTERKSAPRVAASRLCEVAKISGTVYASRIRDATNGLPRGELLTANKRRFTQGEVAAWARRERAAEMRPADQPEFIVSVVNYKGGVTKTTTAVSLAQGLAMRGHRVLMIDLDPQGSTTTLFGVLPESEVESHQTCLPALLGDVHALVPAIRQTYWHGIDLIPAAANLYTAENAISMKLKADEWFDAGTALARALEQVEGYDVVVIDTPPSLGYLTLNAAIAAYGMVMPVLPSAIDFAATSQFWTLFLSMIRNHMPDKTYAFIDILLSRVDAADQSLGAVKAWLSSAYGELLMTAEIPRSSIATAASTMLGTAYDMTSSDVDRRTLLRIREAYDSFVERVMTQIAATWNEPSDQS